MFGASSNRTFLCKTIKSRVNQGFRSSDNPTDDRGPNFNFGIKSKESSISNLE
jgi:hypothetical protein